MWRKKLKENPLTILTRFPHIFLRVKMLVMNGLRDLEGAFLFHIFAAENNFNTFKDYGYNFMQFR